MTIRVKYEHTPSGVLVFVASPEGWILLDIGTEMVDRLKARGFTVEEENGHSDEK